jgi:hypothetical protein
MKWWYGNTDDGNLIEPARNYFDGLMQKRFKGWKDSGTVTDRVWTGSKSNFEVIGDLKVC